MRKILASPAVLGAAVNTKGELIKDAHGYVVYRADELVTRDVWERVQARLRTNPVRAKVNVWPLTQIVFCGICGAPMYGATAKYGDKKYAYYGCVHSLRRDGKCTARRVKAEPLETMISGELLALAGSLELANASLPSGRAYSEDIARVAEQISHLSQEVALGAVSGRDVRPDQEELQRANEELARLASLRAAEARAEPASGGQTFRQRWESLDASGRNELLRSAGVRAVASRDIRSSLSGRSGIPRTVYRTPRTVFIEHDGLKVIIELGGLATPPASASVA